MDNGQTCAHHSSKPSDGLRVAIAVGLDTQINVWLFLMVLNVRGGEVRRRDCRDLAMVTK